MTEETVQWFKQTITSIGHSEPPRAAEFFNWGLEKVPIWYRHLLELTRTHIDVDAMPYLAEQPRPFIALRRELIQAICQQYEVEQVPSGFMAEER